MLWQAVAGMYVRDEHQPQLPQRLTQASHDPTYNPPPTSTQHAPVTPTRTRATTPDTHEPMAAVTQTPRPGRSWAVAAAAAPSEAAAAGSAEPLSPAPAIQTPATRLSMMAPTAASATRLPDGERVALAAVPDAVVDEALGRLLKMEAHAWPTTERKLGNAVCRTLQSACFVPLEDALDGPLHAFLAALVASVPAAPSCHGDIRDDHHGYTGLRADGVVAKHTARYRDTSLRHLLVSTRSVLRSHTDADVAACRARLAKHFGQLMLLPECGRQLGAKCLLSKILACCVVQSPHAPAEVVRAMAAPMSAAGQLHGLFSSGESGKLVWHVSRDTGRHLASSPLALAATTIQCAWRCHAARLRGRALLRARLHEAAAAARQQRRGLCSRGRDVHRRDQCSRDESGSKKQRRE